MANNNINNDDCYYIDKLREKLNYLEILSSNNDINPEIVHELLTSPDPPTVPKLALVKSVLFRNLALLCLIFSILLTYLYGFQVVTSQRCIVRNNYFVKESTRPVTSCSICRDVKEVVVLQNVTKESFLPYAYAGKPVLVKNATYDWAALHTFNFSFFKEIYTEIDGALDSVEDECQFFPFRTDFLTLKDVFEMPIERVYDRVKQPWYVGWSNCHDVIAEILRGHYKKPHFLPDESESSAIDWIFMGYSGPGASMHLDYVNRPSWQAQLTGKKMWRLKPTPECEDVCHSFNVVVDKGDIILIDTNQWYHDTYVVSEEMSVTIGSEYD